MYVFENIDQFLKDFQRGLDSDTTLKLAALKVEQQAKQQPPKANTPQQPPTINATQKAQIQSAHGMLAPFFENKTPQHNFTEVK
ncbi:hypothetical protein, partial [Helicobacter sp. NHP22-001]